MPLLQVRTRGRDHGIAWLKLHARSQINVIRPDFRHVDVGRYVDRKSWSELVVNYAIWRGRLWLIVLATLALTPFLWGRWAARRLMEEKPHG